MLRWLILLAAGVWAVWYLGKRGLKAWRAVSRPGSGCQSGCGCGTPGKKSGDG